ncbi:DUF4296 domain-containing protein [Adhaeribacter sp. BT258]|uniref:DUF4296 domain-containing protein n=1 Tax=Adhaeribacter terrigena TaxID=2793070 RepID=A0ABS1C5Q6_9BACT|nr:DUF4296 domain-containing protein [Adhaeribacter terrigena]MBK0404700.1 DUF4296 domain-containing protein [Adhaeribacter terrigena]
MIFSLFGLFSCAEEKKKLPAGLLPPAKLTSILADIHIAEAQVENMRLSPDTAKVVFNRLQAEVLKKYGVPEKQFDKTYTYYLNNLNDLDKIYESLIDTLTMREVQFTSKGGNTGMKPDSAKPDSANAKKMPDTIKNKLLEKVKARRERLKSIDTIK